MGQHKHIPDELTPTSHILRSMRARNWHLAGAIEELVDNSLGHGKATEVTIHIDNAKGIAVIDNGKGIDDINRIFWYGEAGAYDDLAEIGQYGVGAKDAAVYLGDVFEVTTVYAGRKHTKRDDWERLLKSGHWPKAYRGSGTPAKESEQGTSILIAKLHQKPHFATSERLARELGQVFSPALRRGVEISLTHRLAKGETVRHPVEPYTPEDLTDETLISGQIETAKYGTLRWSGRAGLSASLTDRFNGVNIAFGHRIIETTREPFYGKSAPTLYVEITLDETTAWKHSLSAHKDKIVKNRKELIDSVHAAIEQLLKQSEQQSAYLALKSITLPIEAQLSRALKGAGVLYVDPDEDPTEGGTFGEGEGPVTPGKRQRTPVDDGEPAKPVKPTGIHIDWVTSEQLEGKLWSWSIDARQLTISLDADQFAATVGYPPRVRDQLVIQLVTSFLSHAIEVEYQLAPESLARTLTKELVLRLDEWAANGKGIAPHLNRAILEGV